MTPLLTIGLALLLSAPSPAPAWSDDPPGVPDLAWEVVSRRPHDPGAWTQGLQFAPDGRLFESTGLEGRSSVREVEPVSGAILRQADLPDDQFGEGLALVDDHLVQLTWKEGLAHTWNADDLAPLATFEYEGEGWGLCHDGERLVMSDGSDRLTFRDPASFEVLGGVDVTLDGRPLTSLNELECTPGSVWANVYLTDTIVRIDPADGRVTGRLDLTGILPPEERPARRGAVLNGIARVPVSGTFLVTGKLWPELIEIRVEEGVQVAAD
jgi:glutaminyl-peptide cyclotransferase